MRTEEFNKSVEKNAKKVNSSIYEEGRMMMVEWLLDIITTDDENIYWTGSMTDLAELVYYLYEKKFMRDGYGYPLSYKCLVKQCFAFFHVAEPTNPFTIAARARRRKGIKQPSLLERFCWLHFRAGKIRPLDEEVVVI